MNHLYVVICKVIYFCWHQISWFILQNSFSWAVEGVGFKINSLRCLNCLPLKLWFN